MQQVEAPVREHHPLPVAFPRAKPHNHLIQAQYRRVQRLSMFREVVRHAVCFKNLVYHAR